MQRAERSAGFRPDIEGLRAMAVLLVVFDHLLGWPSGGFVGVDVFFVISGFLITGLLLSERERTGRISFRAFYARRARRILPASIVVLVVTVLAARAVQLTSEAQRTAVDAIWAAAFGANIHFAKISTDYFASGQAHSPVQHYWSLAVEEQYYLVWPLLIVCVVVLAALFGARRWTRPVLAAVLAVGVLASFAYSVRYTHSDPAAAYFATTARAWELGVGALVAIAVPVLRRLPARIRAVGSIAGLGGIAWSAVTIDSATPFPGPGAAGPVLATAVVLGAGVGGVAWTALPMTNPASRYVGRVSYSLYLWHWPVLILLPELMSKDGVAFDVAAAATMAALTIVSFHYIEEPMRRLRWSNIRRRLAPPPRPVQLPRFAVARPGLAAVACAALAVGGWMARPPVQLASITPEVHVSTAGAVRPQPALAHAISEALNAREWPRLVPSLDEALGDRASEWNECSKVDPADPDKCRFAPDGGGARTAVVLGDSVAVSWLPGLRKALVPNGYAVHGMTLMQCGAADVPIREANRGADENFVKSCNRHRHDALQAIADHQPDLVILSSTENSLVRLVSGNTQAGAEREWREGMVRTLRAVRTAAPAARIVVLSPPPEGANVNQCATRAAGPQACIAAIRSEWVRQSRAEQFAVHSVQAAYVDVHLLVCTAAGLCPPFIDGRIVRCDTIHLTKAFIPLTVPYLRHALLAP
ncbi:MAG TPA: acyltransferase family protein [Jatrophihabitantaceae bacterium]|nr:acyltransferase family protein [Jatrophihabitantaceae bacterium]